MYSQMKLTSIIHLRIEPKEKEEWKKLSEGYKMTLSQFIRSTVNGFLLPFGESPRRVDRRSSDDSYNKLKKLHQLSPPPNIEIKQGSMQAQIETVRELRAVLLERRKVVDAHIENIINSI